MADRILRSAQRYLLPGPVVALYYSITRFHRAGEPEGRGQNSRPRSGSAKGPWCTSPLPWSRPARGGSPIGEHCAINNFVSVSTDQVEADVALQ